MQKVICRSLRDYLGLKMSLSRSQHNLRVMRTRYQNNLTALDHFRTENQKLREEIVALRDLIDSEFSPTVIFGENDEAISDQHPTLEPES